MHHRVHGVRAGGGEGRAAFGRRGAGPTVLLLAALGCQGRPVSPVEPIVRPDLSGQYVLAGQVVATSDGLPVAGASVQLAQFGQSTVTSDADGRFSMDAVPAGYVSATISAPGYLTRGMHFDVSGSRADLRFDIIRDAAPFDLTFYRDFARSGADRPY